MIIGSGRMGLRHLKGLLTISSVNQLVVVDKFVDALEAAKNKIDDDRVKYCLLEDIINFQKFNYKLVVLATTANERIKTLAKLNSFKFEYLLIEKPIAQSMNEVLEIVLLLNKLKIKCFVNLNMRMYDYFVKLKYDFDNIQQLKGEKSISINTGALGIGANGIHYLDLAYFLLDADEAEIVASEIEDHEIESGRGSNFKDFGGWALIKYYKNKVYRGKLYLSMTSNSSAFGSWDIICKHGKISIDEANGIRVDTYRSQNSNLPTYKYFIDYEKAFETRIISPNLSDITASWFTEIIKSNSSKLPFIEKTLMAHSLLFNWLENNKQVVKHFPIT